VYGLSRFYLYATLKYRSFIFLYIQNSYIFPTSIVVSKPKKYTGTSITTHKANPRAPLDDPGVNGCKVEVVYDIHTQRRVLKTNKFDILPQWGRFKDIFVLLDREDNYGNVQTR